MEYYSKEFKEAELKRLMPPENMSVPKLAKELGVSATTIHN